MTVILLLMDLAEHATQDGSELIMRHVKFEQAITSKIQSQQYQQAQGTYGVLLDYDTTRNTATILLSNYGSDEMGEVIRDVPCPTTIGVQTVAPENGRPCWVTYKGRDTSFPVVTHFFNPFFIENDYARQTTASNTIPRYMLAM